MSFDPIQSLSEKELLTVAALELKYADAPEQALVKLKECLQIAVEIELATLPVYLYTYYSIQRNLSPSAANPSPINLFADKAGGIIMSVAVEEMLHMSLASNILFSLGEQPKVYGRSPNFNSVEGGGTNLPYHKPNGPDGKPIAIPLAGLSYDTLWGFLEIEYPKQATDELKEDNWDTIGDFYSFIRCIIATSFINDADFTRGSTDYQISDDYYGQNCIDTVYPTEGFDDSLVPVQAGSAAQVAAYPNSANSHAGYATPIDDNNGGTALAPDSEHGSQNDVELNKVFDKASAIQAIATICDQGEGFTTNKNLDTESAFDDQENVEESHYYKFLALQSELTPYGAVPECLSDSPTPPPPAAVQWTPGDLSSICFNFAKNPTTSEYPTEYHDLSNLCNGVYQYILLMTEATYTVSGQTQVELFNVGVHKAMIWVLDKLIQGMRTLTVSVQDTDYALAPTFENLDITSNGIRAKANVLNYIQNIEGKAETEPDKKNGVFNKQLAMLTSNNIKALIQQLPDIDMLDKGLGMLVPVEIKHACMGLNACAGQDRFQTNECAGQGMCYTSNNHTCHTLNDCKQQGGCGLYGTSEEQSRPGGNSCKGHGSCATPINAERFATAAGLEGESVWQLARAAFEERMKAEGKSFDDAPSEAYQEIDGESVAVGPSFKWIKENGCLTACGASGLSGAGSCGG